MYKGLFTTILLTMSVQSFAGVQTICGEEDDRVLSFDPAIGRLFEGEKHAGCTVTMISDSCGITAGHCERVLVNAEFNTPISVDGKPQPSKAEDIYQVDTDSIVAVANGPGDDWAVLNFKPNSITGKLPGEVQGHYTVSFEAPQKGALLEITGYGRDSADLDRNFAQQTHSGKLKKMGGLFYGPTMFSHTVDTMGGNSGSTVIDSASGTVMGIHTHGGCTRNGGGNMGTLISKHKELKLAIKRCLAK